MPRYATTDRKLHEAVGERLQRLRKGKQLSQEVLAELLGVAAETISRYETGSVPLSLSMVYKICTALDVEPCTLVGGRILEHQDEEAEVVAKWRELDAESRQLLLGLLRKLAT